MQQYAIENNVEQKRELIDGFKVSLSSAKKERQEMVTEKFQLQQTLKKTEEELNKEQQLLRIKIIKQEEQLKLANDRLKDMEREREETKKAKLEILQATEAILQEMTQDLTALQHEKQNTEEYLERLHSENMALLSQTIKPLEDVSTFSY